jgi:methyltransferase-like protein/ubiquinone/menaquinone biosynthesis C-methylase UbiE
MLAQTHAMTTHGNTPASTTYDELPYPSHAIHVSQPLHLATLGLLAGLDPPPPETARVLEIGCASGGNLIPLAFCYPQGSYLGIDLSSRQIEEGRALVSRLGLTNIELLPISVTEVTPQWGEFDYIICHGVYSWVPPEVQEKILEVCRQNLAPRGLAYVSYNTYPGWHLRALIREMMNWHVHRFTEPLVKVREARWFLDFLVRYSAEPEGVYGAALREEKELLERLSDSYVFHEHLEKDNQPVYFYQFAERLSAHGLRYVTETRLPEQAGIVPAEVRAELERLASDVIQREQYFDFLRNRTFRRTLICHAEQAVKHELHTDGLQRCYFTAHAKPETESPDVAGDSVVKFTTPLGRTLSTNNPLIKALLTALFEIWPRSWSFEELYTHAWRRVDAAQLPEPLQAARDPAPFASIVAQCVISDAIEVHLAPFRFVVQLSERPLASALARAQALSGHVVCNMRHRGVPLNELDRFILQQLDGTRDRAALKTLLAEAVAAGKVSLSDAQAETIAKAVDAALTRLAGYSLLVA